MEPKPIPGFRTVPRTGVIYVTHDATRRGFVYGHPDWANLGQGSPETGDLAGAPPRVKEVTVSEASRQYGPVAGNQKLRQAVADFYNATHRRGKKSQYTAENVSIASGGRLALTRLASALGNINMGHFIPDYTAYEELLSVFKAFTPIPILLARRDRLQNFARRLEGRDPWARFECAARQQSSESDRPVARRQGTVRVVRPRARM